MTRFAPTLLVATSALALALAACEDRGSARIDAPEPEPLAQLSASAVELPYAQPAPVSWAPPARGYQWAERAYGMQRAFYDVPPDYGFEYDGVEPLVWVSEDDWALYADPWDDGYRYYYYEPGAAYPYFVLDRDYGYGFDSTGVLIAVFDTGGRYLSQDVVYRMAPLAGRYYVRGRDLRNAAVQARRIPVDQQVWADVAPRINRGADPWLRAARDDRAWRQWRERDGDRELRRFVREQRRREDVRRIAAAQPQVPLPAVQGLRQDRQAERLAQRDARQADQLAARQAQAEAQAQRRASADRAQVQAERRQAMAQVQAERGRQAQAERRQAMAQAQAERGRQAQAERQQQARAQAERGQQVQAERRRAMADTQAERGRQQAQAERQAQRQAERRPGMADAQAARRNAEQSFMRERQAQAHAQQAQARAAEQQGRMAAARAEQGRARAQQAQAAQPGKASNDDPRRRGHRDQE